MKQLRTILAVLCLLLLHFPGFSQVKQNAIQGKVVTEQGDPLQGVTITLINEASKRRNFTTSNSEGNFSFVNVSVGQKYTLIFEYVGYQKDSLTHFSVLNESESNAVMMRLKLSETKAALDEVVVVGYGTARKSDVTGSIVSYTPKEAEAATSVSVDAMLQGKVAGMNVTTSSAGGPGAAASVVIRGANSLRSDNQPLYVIDNIPQASTGQFSGNAVGSGDNQIAENPLATLNPSDIESVQVLKDASATAIYGSRGANGVIIITTKKGRSGKAKVNLATNLTMSQATRVPQMLGLRDYVTYRQEQQRGAGNRALVDTLGEIRLVTTGTVYDPNDPATYSVVTEKDWQKAIYRNAFSQNYNLTVNGGNAKTTYFISGGYKNIQGTVDQTGMQIGNMRANLNTDLTDKLKMKFIVSAALRKNNMMSGGDSRGAATGSIISAATFAAPYEIPLTDPIWNSSDPAAIDTRTNALSWLNDYDDISNEKNFGGSLELNWKISNLLSYTLRTGGNLIMQERNRWFGLQLFRGLNSNGYLGLSNLNRNNYTVENLLNFQKNLGENTKLTALAGATYDQYRMANKMTSGQNFNYYDLRTNGINFATVVTPFAPVERPYQLVSFLSRANLSFFDDRYLATVNFRADGSSKFAEANQWAYFPSVALAWRIEKEEFMKSLSAVNQLKLRLGYGVVGNQNIDPFSTLYAYAQSSGSYYATNGGGKVIAINVAGMPNPNIKWETTTSYNAGIDFALWQSRLSGSLDVYRKMTDNLLVSRNLPPSTSFQSIIVNQGALQNRGVELVLSGDVMRTTDLKATLSGNISFNKATIEKLGLPITDFGMLKGVVGYLGNSIADQLGVGNIFLQGYAPGMFYGYQTDGIYQTGDNITITKNLTNNVPVPGDVKFVDQNGDNIIDSKDLTIIGNPNPKFVYGFQPSLRYKNLNLSAAFNGVYGNQVLNANLRYEATPSRQSANIRQSAFDQRWISANGGNLYPSANYNLPNVVMDRYVENGSFLRWSDLTIGYTLPQDIVKRARLQSISLFASGKNLMVWTKYSGNDPEVNSFAFDGLRPGIDFYSYPNSRSYTIGPNIGF